jgi:hypothetical protein
MTSIADAVVALAGNQRPVLALDTCVPLDIIADFRGGVTCLIDTQFYTMQALHIDYYSLLN